MSIRWSEIVGQPAAMAALERAVGAGRLPHGLLFAGPEGVGKRTAALALAARLACSGGGPEAGCACRLCRRIGNPLVPSTDVVQFFDLDQPVPLARRLVLAAGLPRPGAGLEGYLAALARLGELGLLRPPLPAGGGPEETDFLAFEPDAILGPGGDGLPYSAVAIQAALDAIPAADADARRLAGALLGALGPWNYHRILRVAHIRQVLEPRAAARPDEGARRVFILDAAERANEQAQNALLKTLEEPPAWTTIILVTARPHLLLPTIRSRCQELRFGQLPAGVLATEAARRGWAPGDAELRAALARGSLGRLLATDWPAALAQRDAVAAALAVADLARPDSILAAADAMLAGAESFGRATSQLERSLEWLESLLHDAGLAGAGAGAQIHRDLDPADLAGRLGIPPGRLDAARGRVAEARRALRVHVDGRLCMEALMTALARLKVETAA